MTEGKLSEQLAQLGAIDEDGRHAHLCHKARALEAEVERLRDADDCVTRMGDACDRHCKELDAYRAAVAEMRSALRKSECGDIGSTTRHALLAYLDKLPKGEP